MRTLGTLFLLPLLPGLVLAQTPKTKPAVQPIKVVTLTRVEPVSYDKDIEPVFVKKCLVCHSGQIKEGKLDLDSYEVLMKGGKRGKSIVIPGKAEKTRANGTVVETHTEVKQLVDISPVALPAFSGTSVLLNSQDGNRESLKSQITRAKARAKGMNA